MATENQWKPVEKDLSVYSETTRPSLTYWQDVWRRFWKNKLAVVGLIGLFLIVVLAVVGPMLSPFGYADQQLELANLPPHLAVTQLKEGSYVYVHPEFKLISISKEGEILGSPKKVKDDKINRTITYEIDGSQVVFDYSLAKINKGDKKLPQYKILVDGTQIDITPVGKVFNKTYLLGSDKMGRDVWVRNLYGARISLMVGIVAAVVNAVIGVLYGGISGYEGGRVDGVMMRVVDLINSIPLMLIVILLSVLFGDRRGLSTIILTIGLVYWVGMARQVRGQILGLKEQEFVLAARALGANKGRIILRHLIPNALGPILVTMMMSIPSAIFAEAFLSFIGLGVSAPMASWGTLANDALSGLRSFPYLLIIPSLSLAVTMFAFNFVGDGLRDALDPKLRK